MAACTPHTPIKRAASLVAALCCAGSMLRLRAYLSISFAKSATSAMVSPVRFVTS